MKVTEASPKHKRFEQIATSGYSNIESTGSTTPTPSLESLTVIQISTDKRVSAESNDKTASFEYLNTESNENTTPSSVVDSSTVIQISDDKSTPSNSIATLTNHKNAVETVAQDSYISFDYLLKDKNILSANSYRDKRNQAHNPILDRKQAVKPHYWRNKNPKTRHYQSRHSNKQTNNQRHLNIFSQNKLDNIHESADFRHRKINLYSNF